LELATSSGRMHGESSVAGGDEVRSFSSETDWSEVLASAEVSKEADDLGLVTLSWIRVVGASHDHGELSLEPELPGPNEHTDELLVNLFVHWGKIIGRVEEIHCIRCFLNWKG